MDTGNDKKLYINPLDIAVIGMSCSFPKAQNIEQFWENLCNGLEAIDQLSDEELLKKGVSPELLKNPNYVKAASIVEDIDLFDAEFFGINPNEAKSMDPQHRIFLQSCYEALENAGYNPEKYEGDIGVFAGVAMNSYIPEVLSKNNDFFKSLSSEQLMIGNDKDFLPTLVSYKLNLKGPSVNVNTACSTSLVAIHLARQSLLLNECDMVLTGGVSIFANNGKGYMYQKDGIQSPDGHCRAFDAKSRGTIFGDGCGVIVLKRLSDAINDGDNIYAVVKGSAINNDGAQKAGYTAPSVEGQSKAIVEALAVADISPEQINYVEAHGTGTQLGDPIELAALTQAFSEDTDRKGFCSIGSVKTNLGHLNSAAGAAGFIKTVLSVSNKKLPPSLNFEMPNPKIDFENSPFYVNTTLTDLSGINEPIRAGISSMGIGGTNCHVVIEEAPKVNLKQAAKPDNINSILLLSARSSKALEAMTDNLAEHLYKNQELSLKDVEFTLQCGRKAFSCRRAVKCSSIKEAVEALRSRNPKAVFDGKTIETADEAVINNSLVIQWLKGEDIDWSIEWECLSVKRVSLPTYPFEKKRFWVEPAKSDNAVIENDGSQYYRKREDMADWFYVPSWKHSMLPFSAKNPEKRSVLIFADNFNIGEAVSERLKEQGQIPIVVTIGKEYVQKDNVSFILEPSNSEDYNRMLTALKSSNNLPDSILFLWSIEAINEQKLDTELNALIASQAPGFFSILNLVKALDDLAIRKSMQFIIITNNIYDVTGCEDLCITSSTIPGMCVVMQQTYENLNCRIVDIEATKAGGFQQAKIVEALINEAGHDVHEMVCAYRGNKRYVRGYEPIKVEGDAPHYNTIHKDGVYLVFSGLEGIGFLISEHIAKKIGGKVLILEEDGFPERESWEKWLEEVGGNHQVSERINNALDLLGYNAEYIGTITNLKEDCGLLETIEKRFGKINGLIHAPGASNAKRVKTIKASSPDTWYEHFKVVSYSLIQLDQIFKNRELDFRIMLNSLGSVLGGNSFINIATVSNYIKSYITRESRTDKQAWTVQCWDSWLVEWGQIGKFFPEVMYKRVEPSILTNEEGILSFERTFAVKDIVELAISGTDLSSRYNRWVKLESLQKQKDEQKEVSLMPRPEMEVAYEEPKTEIEYTLQEVFSQLLGIEKVGTNDDFFELGGHSLLGVQLSSKVRNIFSIDMDLYQLIGNPTIATLAAYVESLEKNKKTEVI